jgi:hypothetical protein
MGHSTDVTATWIPDGPGLHEVVIVGPKTAFAPQWVSNL